MAELCKELGIKFFAKKINVEELAAQLHGEPPWGLLLTEYYTSIEKVRFPDIEFVTEMTCSDFSLPALTIQPIVENAIKHGLMKLQKGGTIKVISSETKDFV